MAAASSARMARDTGTVHSVHYDDQQQDIDVGSSDAEGITSTTKVTNLFEFISAKKTQSTDASEQEVSHESEFVRIRAFGSVSQRSEPSAEPLDVFRSYFARQILEDVVQLEKHAGEATAAIYADGAMRKIRRFRDQSPFDPYLEILMAFHDAMAFENLWSKYAGTQYAGALKVLKGYVNQDLDNAKTSKAIIKLTQLGFETVPFGVSFDVDEEEQADHGSEST